ncbi:MAG: rod shape-determining protein MreC [Dehalococcoidia bacterium]|nr:MAG: rod shape-determining protein MreC [Dehalococcoidia bacterium]
MLMFSRYSWWVASMIGLAFLLAILGQTGLLNPFQGLFLRATSPVEHVLTAVFRPVASLLSDFDELGTLQDENNRLRLENEDLRNQIAGLQQDAQRVKELESLLQITEGGADETRVVANIVHRASTPFQQEVSIDRGSSAGIHVGMVVLSSQGSLMGTVTKVTSETSFVRLITDTRSKVRAEVAGTAADGIVRGTPDRGLVLELAQGDIKVGDAVVTAGLGGNYPKGIPIGLVSEVSGTSQDLYKKVTIQPLVRLGTATTVLVNISFIPERLILED